MEEQKSSNLNLSSLKSHFEKEEKITIQTEVNNMNWKEGDKVTVQIGRPLPDFRYKTVAHNCHDVLRIFEIDRPTKCDHCGEVIE